MQYSEHHSVEILATMGPTLYEKSQIIQAVRSGATNFRIHMGVRKKHCYQYFTNVRAAEASLKKHIEVLLDLPTAKPRVGKMIPMKPIPGKQYTIKMVEESDTERVIPLKALENLKSGLIPGQRIVFSDGKMVFIITEILPDGVSAKCTFSSSEFIPSISSCVFPDSDVTFDLFEKDDLSLLGSMRDGGLRPDWIAISFADDPERIGTIKEIVHSLWDPKVKIMAKIENKKGLRDFQNVLDCVDGVMVARGDLLACLEPFMLPRIQQELIQKTRAAGKISVVATELLEQFARTGMVIRPELTDIAVAVRQGASAVMLSVESSNCPRANDCITLMYQIIRYEEEGLNSGT